jgi:hypothetical protein
MEDINKWLAEANIRCARLSEAYRLELGILWWANLAFVVTPAVASTAAAVLAAVEPEKLGPFFTGWALPPASVLAGTAAILVAVHKSLKCEEYQAECLRLTQGYQALAEKAAAALSRPETERSKLQQDITNELTTLTASVKARLPTRILRRADERFRKSKLLWLPG